MIKIAIKGKEPRQAIIDIGYPGDVISVNHYLGRRRDGGYYVKPEAKAWMEYLGWLILPYHLEEWELPLTVKCDGWFKDKRSTPDLSNLSKCTLDAIEETTGINDRFIRWEDGKPGIADIPVLRITIRENSK